jgi:hypothetical protein
MEHISNANNQIGELIKDKYSLELKLARELLALFDDESQGIIGELRHICRQSATLLDLVYCSNPSSFRENHDNDLKKYNCFKKHQITSWDMQAIARKALSFSASDCADFIRVYGEVFEKNPSYMGAVTGHIINEQRKEPQKGGKEHWDRKGLRDRDFAKKDDVQSFIHAQLKQEGGEHGILRWVQLDRDTCGKLDKIFGLCPGATISGTTTDNIFFFDKFSRGGIDPLMYLLPIAAIVGNGHHTMIECALPLTLNNKMDYVVGLYSTLLPKPPSSGVRSEAMVKASRAIEGILNTYEADNYNHLMLIYYTGQGAILGAYLFDKDSDRDKWTRFARSSKAMMDFTKSINPYPSEHWIKNLMEKTF